MRGIFLDISKAFNKVWHDGLLYKLKRNDINGDLLKFIESFYQTDTNNLPSELCCSHRIFDDDTPYFPIIKKVNKTPKKLDKDLKNISKWAHQLKMSFNPDLTKMAKEFLLSR